MLTAVSAGSEFRVCRVDDGSAGASWYVFACVFILPIDALPNCDALFTRPHICYTFAASYDEARATEDSFYSAGLVAIMCKSFLCAF